MQAYLLQKGRQQRRQSESSVENRVECNRWPCKEVNHIPRHAAKRSTHTSWLNSPQTWQLSPSPHHSESWLSPRHAADGTRSASSSHSRSRADNHSPWCRNPALSALSIKSSTSPTRTRPQSIQGSTMDFSSSPAASADSVPH